MGNEGKESRRERRTKVNARLEQALAEQFPVKVASRHDGAHPVTGFVVGLGRRWAALALLDEGRRPDGWELVRLRDVGHVERHRDGSVEQRILEARDQWPLEAPAKIALDRARSLATDLVKHGQLVALHVEGYRPEALWVGVPLSLDDGELELAELDPEANWHPSPSFFDVKALTRVSIATGYLTSLDLIAPDRPWEAEEEDDDTESPVEIADASRAGLPVDDLAALDPLAVDPLLDDEPAVPVPDEERPAAGL